MTENAPAMPGKPVEEEKPDLDRRRMLTATTAAVGAAGVALTAVPFIESLEPSETARAHYRAALEALRAGDWTGFGREMEALGKALGP